MNINIVNINLKKKIYLDNNIDLNFNNLYKNITSEINKILFHDRYFKYSLTYKLFLKLNKIKSHNELNSILNKIDKKLIKRSKLIKYINKHKTNIVNINIKNRKYRENKNSFINSKLNNNLDNINKKNSTTECNKNISSENEIIIAKKKYINREMFEKIKNIISFNYEIDYNELFNIIFIRSLKEKIIYSLYYGSLINCYKLKINFNNKILLRFYKKKDRRGLLWNLFIKSKNIKFYIKKLNSINLIIKNYLSIVKFINKIKENTLEINTKKYKKSNFFIKNN